MELSFVAGGMLFFNDKYRHLIAASDQVLFEDLWAWPKDWVEPINQRRDGWSGVTKHALSCDGSEAVNVYLKRQENQLRRGSASWYLARPTFWFEYKALCIANGSAAIGPELVLYADRRTPSGWQSILITKSLEGFVTLEELLADPAQAEHLDRHLENIRRLIKSLHRKKLMHGALYAKHIYIQVERDEYRLIDFERARAPIFSSRAWEKDFQRLFRRTPGLSEKHHKILLGQV